MFGNYRLNQPLIQDVFLSYSVTLKNTGSFFNGDLLLLIFYTEEYKILSSGQYFWATNLFFLSTTFPVRLNFWFSLSVGRSGHWFLLLFLK